MTVKKGSMVKFHYTGYFNTGEEFGSTAGKKPIECKIGEGRIIKGVEEALMGMEKSEKRGVVIPPEKAFGKRDKSLVKKAPKNAMGDNKVEIGQIITMKNKEGRVFDAQVLAIETDTITIDLNHPFADKTLKLNIEVVDISE